MRRLLPLLLLLGSCDEVPVFPEAEDACSRTLMGRTIRVIDGDTIEFEYLDGDREGYIDRVRLVGIDTPELSLDDCYAPEARDELQRLMDGEDFWLVHDQVCSDTNGRVLAYVYRASDEFFVNRHMVERGFASACPVPPNDLHSEDFARLQDAAWADQIGQWGEPCHRELFQCFGTSGNR